MRLNSMIGLVLAAGLGAGWCGCRSGNSDLPRLEAAPREAKSPAAAVGTRPASGYVNPSVDAERLAGGAIKNPPLRMLVVGAHPADIFDQSGGTMAHHVNRGDWVGCVVLTHGARVHDKVIADEMRKREDAPPADELTQLMKERADVKTREIIRACSILGVKEGDVYFMGADDAVLLLNEPMIRAMARLIRKLRPDIVITHFPLEDAGLASAHATCGQIVLHALDLAGGVEPGDRSRPHKVTQVFFFGIGAAATRTHLWGAQGGFYNDIFVDITDVAEKKVACLDAVASQSYAGAYARKRIESSDGAFGSRMRFAYAEGFISLNSTSHYYLPLSEIDRHRVQGTDEENLGRSSFRVHVP